MEWFDIRIIGKANLDYTELALHTVSLLCKTIIAMSHMQHYSH